MRARPKERVGGVTHLRRHVGLGKVTNERLVVVVPGTKTGTYLNGPHVLLSLMVAWTLDLKNLRESEGR